MDLDAPINEWQTAVHTALRAWNDPGGSSESLLAVLRLVQTQRRAIGGAQTPTTLRLAANQVLLSGIEALEIQDAALARVLRVRFIEGKTLYAVANSLNVSEHTVSRLQRAAIELLAEIIRSQEMVLHQQEAQAIEVRLPPASYSQLFGLQVARDELLALLLQPDAPWTVALVGLGGIGKTALADSVVRQLIRRFFFADVIWVRAEAPGMNGRSHPIHLPYEDLIVALSRHFWPDVADNYPFQRRVAQVRQMLKERPFLVIIDNLESETDAAYLLSKLNDLAAPSKFLLTSRARPSEQATIFNFAVAELSLEAAGELLRHHAREIGVPEMVAATQDDITDIYRVVGGNPLALKLVVSLLDLLPLRQILAALSRSQTGPIEDLYRHIYWQSWQMLSPSARNLLQAMPLVAVAGGDPDYLYAISGLSQEDFWPALQELRRRSLLEVRGTLQEKRYGIHRLTESFLQTEIIRWPDEGAGA